MFIRSILLLFTYILIIFSLNTAFANSSPVAALWKTYDLKGQERSILKFYEVNGELRADVVKILLNKGVYCTQCKGTLKNKPYMGMTIIYGLKLNNNKWMNGEVLDTDSGNTYRCNISLSEDGNTMYFHAYKGIPLLGRTVEWRRVN